MRGVGWGRTGACSRYCGPDNSRSKQRDRAVVFFNPRFLSTEQYDRDRDQFEFSSSVQIPAMVVRKSLY